MREPTRVMSQLPAWLAPRESAVLEFKKSTAEKGRACRTLCAFANGQGGRVLFGVTAARAMRGWSTSPQIDPMTGKVTGKMIETVRWRVIEDNQEPR